MKIHVPTGKIFNTDKQAYLFYRSPEMSNGKAEPIETIVWSDWDIEEYIVLPVDSATQKRTKNLVDTGDKVYAFAVVALTQEELDDKAENQLHADLQSATIASAILITEVFSQLQVGGFLNPAGLSQEAKDQFATLTALVAQHTS